MCARLFFIPGDTHTHAIRVYNSGEYIYLSRRGFVYMVDAAIRLVDALQKKLEMGVT
jgi:hypothetical protein